MTDKELRRLSRRELLDIIYQLKKNEKKLTARLEEAEQKLQEREILVSRAGSIAEAALALNGVFEAAQAAADDYLRSVKASHREPDIHRKELKALMTQLEIDYLLNDEL